MDFTQVDGFVNYSIQKFSRNIRYYIEKRVEIWKHERLILDKEVNQRLRNFSYIENFHPYKSCDINEYRDAMTHAGLKKFLYGVPNTMHVEIETGDHYNIKLDLYVAFDKRFEKSLSLEKEYEYDVNKLLYWIKPIGLTVNIKFHYYYL